MQRQIAEASELGLKPGEWPPTLGDGYWVKSGAAVSQSGELVAIIYTHDDQTLEVLND